MSKSIFFILLLWTSSILAAYQDPQSLLNGAKDYLVKTLEQQGEKKITADITPLDPRLKLAPCLKPLEYSLLEQRFSGMQRMINVICSKPAWRIYVSAKLNIPTLAVVTSRNLNKNTLIESTDLTTITTNKLALFTGYYDSIDQVTHKVLKRNLRAGEIITPQMMQEELLIKRGEMVLIRAGNEALQVEMKGIAQENGSKNDKIKVVNSSSKRIIEGIVVGRGQVEVTL